MSYFDIAPPQDFQLLTGHVSEETSKLVEDYPYGRQRTQIRYWIETVKGKGDRFCSQTLNPKTGRWNKPKKSTYTPVRFMNVERQEDGRDFIKADAAFSMYADADQLETWVETIKEIGLPEQRAQFALILAIARETKRRRAIRENQENAA